MVHKRLSVLAAALALAVAASITAGAPAPAAPAPATAVADLVHLNQIQVVGSHNSYHLLATQAERELRRSVIGDQEDSLEYQHDPLAVQFGRQEVRQIELDVFNDPEGGLYSDPLIRRVTGGGPMPAAMDNPGLKVLHIQDVDYHSNCLTLKACLHRVKAWSDAHRGHVPIAILLELKDDSIGIDGTVTPPPFDEAAMNRLDAEIRSVFPAQRMVTPDDVRGTHATLEESVLAGGWPTLRAARGKVMFLMDNGEPYRSRYLAGHPGLQGRVVFTNSEPGQPDAAFVKRNDAIASEADIRNLVSLGYVVRTRADADTVEARTDDPTTRRAAFRSGAQWVSTDYPANSRSVVFSTPYHANLPGDTVARCNPVNRPVGCVDARLDLVEG